MNKQIGYYAPNPYDDLDDLLSKIKSKEGKDDPLLVTRPLNYMLNHNDYFD